MYNTYEYELQYDYETYFEMIDNFITQGGI